MPVEGVLLAFGASAAFGLSTLFFKKFAVEISPLWMNCFKALIAGTGFFITALLFGGFHHQAVTAAVFGLALSGLLGLNIGDLFLMHSFRAIGSGRTLMIYSFNPLFLGLASYVLFRQELRPQLWVGIGFLSLCLFLLGLEHNRRVGAWQLSGYLQALAAALLDSAGVLLTRWSLDLDPGMSLPTANFWRCFGALVGFLILSWLKPFHLVTRFRELRPDLKLLVVTVSLTGTFLSLFLWIGAIRLGPVGVVAAIGATGPLLVTAVETVIEGRRPTWHLFTAAASFAVGIIVINLG